MPSLEPTSSTALAQFDAEWYLKAYSEARDAIAGGEVADAEQHFRKLGAARGLQPNVLFSESSYRERYPEVAAEVEAGRFATGFDHFLLCGQHEGRHPHSLWLDVDWYRDTYPEADAEIEAGRFKNAFDHYLREGAARRYSPHAAFDEDWYLQRYGDIEKSVETGRYLCGYQHFMEDGRAEGRQPHPLYSEENYRRLHPEVDTEVSSGRLASAYLHLVTSGLAEGRPWELRDPDQEIRQAATHLARCRLEQFFFHDRTLVFASPEQPDVSILLVLYNRAELTFQCLESLRLVEGVTFEVIVVDNDSRDRTRELLRRLEGIRVILNDENAGFTRACNQAAAKARGRHLLFLNNDTELYPASLRSAVTRLEATSDAGVVGGRVIALDSRLQEAGSIVWKDGSTQGYGRGDDPLSGAYLYPREVDYCSGVYLLTPRELFERLDGFDETFAPAYYEESDYCFRLRREGFKVIYDPGSVLLHHECASLSDPKEVNKHLARNRPLFLERHGEALADAWEPDVRSFFPAGNRRRYRGRILMLDDHVPLQRLGGGSPRAQEILHALCGLDFFVTFFATNPLELDWRDARRELFEDHLELINHLGRPGFNTFWNIRRDCYDILVVCRPHNLERLLAAGFDPAAERARLIYDAEAVVGQRRALRQEVLGPEAVEPGLDLAKEIELARRAEEIWVVSEGEGKLLAGPDQRFTVVAHGTEGEPGERPFAERRGVLFVGRLDEEWNPNVDALRWYLTEIHPRTLERFGEEAVLTVVGEPGEIELPEAENVRFLGRVPELAPLYDAHRVFVAPTRFAAGIPHKVTSAALHGLPVVASSLLARQLDWHDGVEIAAGGDNDAERFAAQVTQVYTQEDVWHTLRSNALGRARREHSREALRAALSKALSVEDLS